MFVFLLLIYVAVPLGGVAAALWPGRTVFSRTALPALYCAAAVTALVRLTVQDPDQAGEWAAMFAPGLLATAGRLVHAGLRARAAAVKLPAARLAALGVALYLAAVLNLLPGLGLPDQLQFALAVTCWLIGSLASWAAEARYTEVEPTPGRFLKWAGYLGLLMALTLRAV